MVESENFASEFPLKQDGWSGESAGPEEPVGALDWETVEEELGMLLGSCAPVDPCDRNYHRAQESLKTLLSRLNLSPREQSGLDGVLQSMDTLLSRLEHTVIRIAAVGLVGRGKSSTLNALLGQEAFATGALHGVTQAVERQTWTVAAEGSRGEHQIAIPGLGESRIELIDTPGLDEIDGEQRAALTAAVAKQVDLVLFVVAGDLTRIEHDALAQLQAQGKPVLLVFNKVDLYAPGERQQLESLLQNQGLEGLVTASEVVLAAAAPLAAKAVTQADGRTVAQMMRGQPQVEELKLKILEVLQREGKALVAVNSLLYANEISARIVERKQAICERAAEDMIWNAALTAAVAVALNPVTLADVLGGAAVDVVLIMMLSRLYGLPLTQRGAVNLLRTMALELSGISMSELLVTLGLGSLKSLLGAAAPATAGLSLAPYVPVALAQAASAGVGTYSLGQITKAYLVRGATWGAEGPRSVISDILDALDDGAILKRLKQELQSRLETHSHD